MKSSYRLAEGKGCHAFSLRSSLEASVIVVKGVYFVSVLSLSCLQSLTDSIQKKYVCLLTDCPVFSLHLTKTMSFGYYFRPSLVGLTTLLRGTSNTRAALY